MRYDICFVKYRDRCFFIIDIVSSSIDIGVLKHTDRFPKVHREVA